MSSQANAAITTRALVVDDASIFRRVVSEVLSGIAGVAVVGTASNGRMALSQITALQPDLVTLDIEMPEMNGIEVLEAMRKAGQAANVIVLSSRTIRGGEMTMRALEAGAFDFVPKPQGGTAAQNLAELNDRLRPMVQALARRREISSILHRVSKPANVTTPAAPVTEGRTARRAAGSPIVLIGVSTGGPNALAEVLPALPKDLGAPVFIVQHMPPMFTSALAERLHGKSAITVKEARDGEIAEPNCVYLAPGGKQMKIGPAPNARIAIRVTDDPPENACRPSVDYLFRSAALHFPGRSIAAVLTGMGNDGTEGMRMLKRAGGVNIAQDEASCVVYGMPREAFLAGVVDTVVPLNKVAGAIVRAIAGVRA